MVVSNTRKMKENTDELNHGREKEMLKCSGERENLLILIKKIPEVKLKCESGTQKKCEMKWEI